VNLPLAVAKVPDAWAPVPLALALAKSPDTWAPVPTAMAYNQILGSNRRWRWRNSQSQRLAISHRKYQEFCDTRLRELRLEGFANKHTDRAHLANHRPAGKQRLSGPAPAFITT